MGKLHDMRLDYELKPIEKAKLAANPVEQFDLWFKEALAAKVPEANAMVLSTANGAGQPSGRIVLLKDYNESGFIFFTNYNSRKADDIAENPKAALTLWWQPTHQQVRIEGILEKTSRTISEDYFSARSKMSNLAASASPQSQVIPSRQYLMDNFTALKEQYADTDKVPRPEHWGGYILIPSAVEFWSGGELRLHDRFLYTRDKKGAWRIERLAP